MKYQVSMSVVGCFVCTVDAADGNIDEIKRQAAQKFCDADFGELKDSDADFVCAEADDGSYIKLCSNNSSSNDFVGEA